MKRTKTILFLSITTLGLIFLISTAHPSDSFSTPTIFQQSSTSYISSSSSLISSTLTISTSTPGFDVFTLLLPFFMAGLLIVYSKRKKNTF